MDKKLLELKIKGIEPQAHACEYCPRTVTNQRIECTAHRYGTPWQHFRHTCKTCGFVLYDGSNKEPRKRPTAVESLKELKTTPGRRKTKAVQTPAGIFPSLTAMSAHYGKNPSTMVYWMKQNPTEFYYVS
jgi:hypothetical protein